MGWLEHLFGIKVNFNRKGLEQRKISINELGSWLEGRKKELLAQAQLQEEMLKYMNEMKDVRWNFGTKLEAWVREVRMLADAELRGETRVLFEETKRLLEKMSFPLEMDLEKVLKVHALLGNEAKLLLERIDESEFAHNFMFLVPVEEYQRAKVSPINPLVQEVLVIDALQSRLEQVLIASGLQKIDALEKKAKLLQAYSEKIQRQQQTLAEKRERLKTAEVKLAEKEACLAELKEHPAYQDLGELEKKRKQLVVERNELSDKIFVLFSKFRMVLERYSELYPDDVTSKSYMKDPLKAFLQDEGLMIVHVLNRIEAAVRGEKLVLPLTEANAFLERVESLRQSSLEDLRSRYLSLRQQLELMNSEMKNRDFLLKVEDAHYRLEHFKTQTEKLREDIDLGEEEISENEEMRSREVQQLQDLARISLEEELVVEV